MPRGCGANQERCAGAPPSSAPSSNPDDTNDENNDNDSSMNGDKVAPCHRCSPNAGGTTTSTAPSPNPNPSAKAALTNALATTTTTTSETAREGQRQRQRQRQGQGQEEYGKRFEADAGYVDVDTRVSRESYGAARVAAGAVILAVSE